MLNFSGDAPWRQVEWRQLEVALFCYTDSRLEKLIGFRRKKFRLAEAHKSSGALIGSAEKSLKLSVHAKTVGQNVQMSTAQVSQLTVTTIIISRLVEAEPGTSVFVSKAHLEAFPDKEMPWIARIVCFSVS